MNITFYPDKESVTAAMEQDEPLLVLVGFNVEQVILSQIDEAVEHHILLRKVGLPNTDIDKYFRIVLDRSGADWTFVCPPDYCGITRKDKRIERFFKDGMTVIPEALKELGYDVPVEIPKRYRRHFDMMGD
ncbi:MAG: hypothetical protein J6K17_05190 [Oscillospiraceae bacterium]|nr:hypothetical protein [Oscillospiraceae bacterium]